MMDEDRLDELLKAPLPTITDDGFSMRVAARIENEERREFWTNIAAAAGAATVFVAFVPVSGAAHGLDVGVRELAMSVPFAMACAALALTQAGLRLFAD